jgi:hypothetical protein
MFDALGLNRVTVPSARMSPQNPDPPATSSEEHGHSLLRSDAECSEFRERMEVPSRWGRYVLVSLGVLIVGAATGIWFAHPSPAADGLLVFGLVLVVLGFVQHRLLLRDRDHWPKQAYLWAEGLELVLSNGEIRAAPWSDPKFVLDLYARPMKDGAPDEFLLVWKMDPKIPMCPITSKGFERVREAAVARGLEFSEYRADNRRRTLRGFEIRVPPPTLARSSQPAESNQPAL